MTVAMAMVVAIAMAVEEMKVAMATAVTAVVAVEDTVALIMAATAAVGDGESGESGDGYAIDGDVVGSCSGVWCLATH